MTVPEWVKKVHEKRLQIAISASRAKVNAVSFFAYYAGPLDQYTYNNTETGNLLEFLKSCKNPDKIWLGDNMCWPKDIPSADYDTYIFTFFGENISKPFLVEASEKLKGKNLILISSMPGEPLNIPDVKVFYIEHLHKYVDFYPQAPIVNISSRANKFGYLSNRVTYHRALILSKLLDCVSAKVYGYNSANPTEWNDTKTFYPGLANYFSKSIKDIFSHNVFTNLIAKLDKVKSGAYDNIIERKDHHGWDADNPAYVDSQIHICAETLFTSKPDYTWPYLTEKVIKPIVSGTPFITVGQKSTNKKLKDLGFKLYYEDQVLALDNLDDYERMAAILELISELDSTALDTEYLQSVADFNYNYCYTDFVDSTSATNSITEKEIVEYINNL